MNVNVSKDDSNDDNDVLELSTTQSSQALVHIVDTEETIVDKNMIEASTKHSSQKHVQSVDVEDANALFENDSDSQFTISSSQIQASSELVAQDLTTIVEDLFTTSLHASSETVAQHLTLMSESCQSTSNESIA